MNTVEHPYVAISGDIGVGKSTAGNVIADGLGYTFYPEPDYRKNPFFLQKGRAYQSETYFLYESIQIVRQACAQLMHTGVVVDVPPEQHANDYPVLLLDERELVLYRRYYETLKDRFSSELMDQDLIVYLEAQPDVILERIRRRGRPFEQNITVKDIELHTKLNYDWIAQSHLPALFISTDDLDILHSKQAREFMVTMVRDKLNSHA